MSRNLRSLDMMIVDELFEMHGGDVLNFSDRTFANFFSDELGIDMVEPGYSVEGGSKAKRLRYFLQTADMVLVAKALIALWEYCEVIRKRQGKPETVQSPPGLQPVPRWTTVHSTRNF